MDRVLDFFLASAASRVVTGRDYCIDVEKGIAAVSDAGGYGASGHATITLANECASLAVDTIAANCADDPSSVSIYLRELERPMLEHYSPARLVASMRLANRKLRERVAAREPGAPVTSTSLAAFMMTDRGLFVAWAGRRARVHRVHRGGYENLTPTIIETLRPHDAKGFPDGALALGPADNVPSEHVFEIDGERCSFIAKRELGLVADAEASIHEAYYPIRKGDWIIASSGWPVWFEQHERRGESLLAFLAEYADRIDQVLAECMRRSDWSALLPAPVARCNHDLG